MKAVPNQIEAEQKHGPGKKPPIDHLTVIFGFLLAFVAGIAFGDYPREIGAALKDIEPSIAAVAGLLLAWVTWRLVTDGRRSSQRGLRAYVFIEVIEADPKKSLDMLTNYAIQIKNSGKTPAYDVTVRTGIGIGPPDIGRVAIAQFPDDPSVSRSPLAPDCTLVHTQEARRWEPPETARLAAGDVVYLVGRIEYVDAFGRDQWTTFQHVRAVGSHELHACAQGNDAKRDEPD